MISHLVTFLGSLVPFGNILAPLGVWLGQRKYSTFVEDHSRESLNFQLSVILYTFVVPQLFATSFAEGIMAVLTLYVVFAVVLAAWRAHHGKANKYFLSIRFIR